MRILFLALALLLTGCSTTSELSKVFIPVPAKHVSVAIPDKPYLPIQSLTDKSSAPEVMKAYVVSVQMLNNWGEDNHAIAKAYQD